jgi:hypothetical protein
MKVWSSHVARVHEGSGVSVKRLSWRTSGVCRTSSIARTARTEPLRAA